MLFKKKHIKLESAYLTDSLVTAKSSRLSTVFCAIVFSIFAMVFLGTTAASIISSSGSILAHAEKEEEGQKKIQEAADEYLPKPVEGREDEALFGALDKMNEGGTVDTNSFGYVLERLFTIHYINDTTAGYSATKSELGKQCEVNNTHAGTPIYHNCDVPNILTELVQDFMAVISQQGIVGGERSSATLDFSMFGLPQGIPANGAPVNPNERQVKYTALELYGYNLSYTTYNGEWDHIKVMTAARAMSNFGFMDDLKMGVTSIGQGISGGVSGASQGFVDGMSTGGFFGAVGGGFSGFWEGAASGSINSILDTSDQNVFDTYAWYRVGYGGTLYNARELTETEMAARTQNALITMLTSKLPETAAAPQDLLDIRNGPPAPKEAISKCTIVNDAGSNEEISYGKIAPGVSEDDCKRAAQVAFEARDLGSNPKPNDKATYTWSADGNQKKETLVQWKKNYKSIFDTASKYELNCDLNTDENNRADNIATFRLCWENNFDKVAENSKNQTQYDNDFEWLRDVFSVQNVSSWFTDNHDDNYNAPWNRYVCVDKNGKDILDSDGQLTPLYDYNGDLNPGCGLVRPPIQNGFFGNGYLSGQPKPGADTRYNNSATNFTTMVFPINRIVSTIGNIGLMIATLSTRVSNTFINLSFNPILDALGIDDIIVKLIEGFRESLFFPLVTLFIGLAGIQIIWNIGRKKDYQTQAVSLLMLCLTIIFGTVLMFKPEQTIRAVDTLPAMIESAIMGSIFSIGNRSEDNLCYATGSISGTDFKDLSGQRSGGNTNLGTRVLMCENWKTFAFNPWVRGQWGTDYENLFAANTGKTNMMKNTNEALVGNASVNMGGKVTEQNWALYQLDLMSSGTAYYKDLTTPTGRVDPNMYRLVDLQAGPNNGAGTDPRYFSDWSGNGFNRAVIGPFAGLIGIFGAVVIIAYSIAKIQIAFVTTLMLVLIPFMFLFGIHPTMGRTKLKAYMGSILGLMIQRIVLVMIIAVLFRVVSQLGSMTEDYFMSAAFIIAILIFFFKIRKELLNFVFQAVSSGFGQPIGQQFMNDPKQWINKNVRNKEGSTSLLANNLRRAQVGVTAYAGGAIGGWMAAGKGNRTEGVMNSIKADATKTSQQAVARLKNRQRHRGFGMTQTMIESRRAAEKATEDRIVNSEAGQEARTAIYKNTVPYQQYQEELNNYNSIEGEEIQHPAKNNSPAETYKLDSEGEKVFKPEAPDMKDIMATGAIASRTLKKQIKAQEQLTNLKAKEYDENLNSIRNASQDSRDFMKEHEARGDSDEESQDTQYNKQSYVSNIDKSSILYNKTQAKIQELEDKIKEQEDKLQDVKQIKDSVKKKQAIESIQNKIKAYNDQIDKLNQRFSERIDNIDPHLKAQEDIRKGYINESATYQNQFDKTLEKGIRMSNKQMKTREDINEMKDAIHNLVERAKNN